MPSDRIDRRQFLKCTALGLLATSLGSSACAGDNPQDASFNFIVVNDTHYKDDNCAAYLRAAFEQMTERHRFDFVLVAGDVSTMGKPEELTAFRNITKECLPVPVHCVLGNHDCPGPDRRAWVETYGMDSVNFSFDHKGWTFLGIDTTDRGKSSDVVVSPETLAWIRNTLRSTPSRRPLVLFGHHPLAEGVHYRVVNADEILNLFAAHNLRHVFNGHFHGLTEKKSGSVNLTTNRCLSFSRGNHDGSKEKGYFLARAADGNVTYEFVEFKYGE